MPQRQPFAIGYVFRQIASAFGSVENAVSPGRESRAKSNLLRFVAFYPPAWKAASDRFGLQDGKDTD